MIDRQEIAGVILAGGKGSRMGYQDKALLKFRHKPLIEHVIATASEQVDSLVLSVNRNQQLYEYLDLPIVADLENQYSGPLVGIHRAMAYLREESPNHKYLACFPADAPIFPQDLVIQLAEALEKDGTFFSCCRHHKQIQPLFSLWSLDAESSVKLALDSGIYGPKLLLPVINSSVVEISDQSSGSFFNINTVESLEEAEKFTK